jgi:Mrp family chromosome partitioning ATPase
VGVVTDPTVLSARVDGTLLVVEPNKTKLGAAIAAVEQLRRADANVIGVVFNNVSLKRAGYYTGYSSGYYYYQYAYSYTENEDGKEPGRFSSLRAKQGKKKAAK